MDNALETSKNHFYNNIKTILQEARDTAYKQVNFIMVEAYWHIGQQIVKEEQKGEDGAKYGSSPIKELSERLTADFGKGFSKQSLWNMKQFYQAFPILSTLWRELGWSHYKLIIRLKDEGARAWYMQDKKLFVSKYQMYLPTEEELRAEIERGVLELGLRG